MLTGCTPTTVLTKPHKPPSLAMVPCLHELPMVQGNKAVDVLNNHALIVNEYYKCRDRSVALQTYAKVINTAP
jgi:hypothetical protein